MRRRTILAPMPGTARRVVLISGHYLGSKRRAGFHHLAEAYWRAGWDVTFVTAHISLLSRLRRDYRFEYPVRAEANTFVTVRERLTSFVLMTPLHPVSLRSDLADRLAAPLFARYARISLKQLEGRLAEADLVVFEGSAALLLVDRIRNLAPRARLVYRASDDLRRLGLHPLILDAEARAIPVFDEVSVPTAQIADVLARFGTVHIHPPGIDKAAFDRATESPYGDGPNAVFAGVSPFFDYESLLAAAQVAPHVSFHVIGPRPRPLPENVVFHPEMPFDEVVPYLQHATFGLLFFPGGGAAASLSGEGNKVAQYSYCRLPIVAPAHLEVERGNICVFEPGDPGSLRSAIARAERMEHSASFAEGVLSADELAAILAGEANEGAGTA
jgi:2-beta-glucuronyltransferase